jgi:hypothetical protein
MTKEKETPNEKRLKKEKELDKLSRFGIGMRYENRGAIGKLIDKVTGNDDMYGTSASAGARYAGEKKSDKIWNTEDKTVGEAIKDPRARKAMREAAAEERREARGMKKGGSVKPGLYANIHAKRKRIAAGSGEKMRKVGSKGAPTKKAFIKSAKTAKRR